MSPPLRLGTRGSALARAQSHVVADAVMGATGQSVELVVVSTFGDTNAGPLARMPEPGVFVSGLRRALAAGEVDFVVHSMKDLPSEPAPGIGVAAVPRRADAHDALVSRDNLTLDRLAAGARVGTSSPRRTARLRARRPDLVVVDLRGNVDSRIEKVRSGLLDAAVLAVAGLVRLGRGGEIDEVIDMATMLPAPGQGALTIECRDTDVTLLSALAFLDDDDSHVRTTAERAVLSAVGATCASAVGAYAVRDAGVLTLTADVSGADPGQHVVHTHSITLRGDDSDRENARRLGAAVGAALLDAGAAAFVNPGVDRD